MMSIEKLHLHVYDWPGTILQPHLPQVIDLNHSRVPFLTPLNSFNFKHAIFCAKSLVKKYK